MDGMKKTSKFLTMAALFAATGCGAAGEVPIEDDSWVADEAFENGKSDEFGLGGPTANLNAAQWHGYDPAFDRVTPNRCIESDGVRLGATAPRHNVPTLRFIRSRQELAEELGVDLKVAGDVSVADAQVGMKMLNEFSRSSDRVAFLLRVTADYAATPRNDGNGQVVLSERGRSLLASQDINGFLSECGTHYINGVRYGGEIDVLLSFSADDEKLLTQLTGSVGADVTGAPVRVDAEVRRKMEEASSKLDISVTTASSGFTLSVPQDEVDALGAQCKEVFRSIGGSSNTNGAVDSLLADLVAQQPNALPRLFGHIDCLTELMRVSIERDAERCRKGDCTNSSAAPREVILEDYRGAQASDLSPQLTQLEAERLRVKVNLDDMGAMRARTRAVYWDELAPFLAADQTQKARYTVPMADTETVQELQDIANTWSERFSPLQSADVERGLTRRIDECRMAAAHDAFHRCVPEGSFVEELDEMVAAESALAEYAATGRIVPLQVVIAPDPMNYQILGFDDATDYCEAAGVGYRLPRVDELADLDLLVRSGPVPSHTMWVEDEQSECGIGGSFYDPHAQPAMECSTLGKRGTVCVSPAGLHPVLERP